VTDAADKIVGGALAVFYYEDLDGRELVVGAKD
jgi:hypothetical protein